MAKELHSTPSTISNWCGRDDMPKHVLLALDSLRSSRGGKWDRGHMFLAMGPRTKLQVLIDMADQMNVKNTVWEMKDVV